MKNNAQESSSVLPSLTKFIEHEFTGLLPNLSQKAKFEFIELVKLLVFSHRHNKNDDYLKNPLIPFNIIRDPMYMYSRNSQNKFFSYSTYAFLFSWFEAKPESRLFSSEKFKENDNPNHSERMKSEII